MPARRHNCFVTQVSALLVAFARTAIADDAQLFDYREVTLDNGLRVVTLEDFSCPVVAVQLWYHVGSKDENPERQGFAHMFEHMMFRGTDRLGPTDHFDLIRRTGGDCNAYTSFDNTTYVQTLPAHQLELSLWLEAERMAFLKIDQTAFDTERKVVEEERRLGLNRPYGTVPEKVLPEVFKTHPYRWSPIGRIPHLRASEVQELRDFWTRYYVPNNAVLVIVGAVKHDDAQALARKCFGWIPRYPDPPRVSIRDPLPSEARAITIKEDNAPLPAVGYIFRTVGVTHPDYVPLQMLAMILGGGSSSRLYREIVADKQLAIVAASIAFSFEQDGVFAAGAALNLLGGDTKKVLAVIDEHLQRIRSEPVTERELTKARNQMLTQIVAGNLTVASKASLLGNAALIEGDTSAVNRRIERIRAVTAADLQRVAQTYLADERGLKITIERNLLKSLFGRKRNQEDDAPITAKPETAPPAPGRIGLARPAQYAEKPPIAGALATDPTPRFESKTLGNGLKVVVVQNHEVPYVSATLGLQAGAWIESSPGSASLATGMLTKGAGDLTEAQLADELETYGISLGGSASLDTGSVELNCLPEHVERAVKLMGDVVLRPTFPADEFEKLRKQVRSGLAVSAAEPGYIAERELRRRLYGEHPYARTATGEPEDIDKLKVADVKAFWQEHARPDTATLYFAGDIDPANAYALAEKTFGDWKAERTPPQYTLPPIPKIESNQVFLVDYPGVQSQIRVGFPGLTRDHPDYFYQSVVSGYFGGAFNSRLNDTIRVKKGLTYGAGGGFSTQRFAGQFRVSTFSKTESTGEALDAVVGEIKRLTQEPPSEKELNDTRAYILGSFAGDRETPQQVVDSLWNIEYNRLPADYYEQMLKTVAAATAEDCMRLIHGMVDPSRMVIVVVGSAQKVKSQIEQFGTVSVIGGGDAE